MFLYKRLQSFIRNAAVDWQLGAPEEGILLAFGNIGGAFQLPHSVPVPVPFCASQTCPSRCRFPKSTKKVYVLFLLQ